MTDNAISPLRRMAGGCHLNRKIDELIRLAGFDLTNLHFEYAPGPTPCPICTRMRVPESLEFIASPA